MENLIKKTKRYTFIKNMYDYNEMNFIYNKNTRITECISYNTFILPLCLFKLEENNNIIKLTIEHQNHNLLIGDIIDIVGAISYFYIDSSYINQKHIITNVNNNKYYEIEISNINKIESVGNTYGGNAIKIKTNGIFRLFFNFKDTVGKIMGFNNIGYPLSVTQYSNKNNDYVIKSTDLFMINLDNNNVHNNINKLTNISNNYILLLCNNFNNCLNLNGINYFYKFLLNSEKDNIYFNTFVQTPLYFNPPLRTLSKIEFKFVNSDGSEYDFNNANYSFTIEITTIENNPENTNMNNTIARI
jgi:hypothetical protein